jgi:hypothetical protein
VPYDLPSFAASRVQHSYLLRLQRLASRDRVRRPAHPQAGDETVAVFLSAILLPLRGEKAALQTCSLREKRNQVSEGCLGRRIPRSHPFDSRGCSRGHSALCKKTSELVRTT